MKSGDITKQVPEKKREEAKAWARLDAMSEVEKHEAALPDPDAQPQKPERLASSSVHRR
jgi:hypothetical protein